MGDGVRVWREVVGVSRGVRHYLTDPPRDEMYVPAAQTPPATWIWFGNGLTLVVRTMGAASAVLPNVRAAVAAEDPALPVYDVHTYDELRHAAAAQNRFATLLFSSFALLAVTLAAVGVYGVLAYVVGQRTQEIAVRMALGARRGDVVALVLRQGGRLAAAGIVLGLLLAVASSRALDTLLYGVAPTDPLTYALVALGLGAVALASSPVGASSSVVRRVVRAGSSVRSQSPRSTKLCSATATVCGRSCDGDRDTTTVELRWLAVARWSSYGRRHTVAVFSRAIASRAPSPIGVPA